MQKKQVVIIENETFTALNIKKSIEKFGYVVLEVLAKYEDAINYVQSNENIDLILINIDLNVQKDGIETIKDIKKIKDIPFIYLSADTDNKTIEEAVDTKPICFLYKPFKYNQIKAALALFDRKIETGQLSNTREFKY